MNRFEIRRRRGERSVMQDTSPDNIAHVFSVRTQAPGGECTGARTIDLDELDGKAF